jgi:hypothetical protein
MKMKEGIMKKIVAIFLFMFSVLILSGCTTYEGHLMIKKDLENMKFTHPPIRSTQEMLNAENSCKELVSDEAYFNAGVFIGTITTIMAKKRYDYQDCMADKGYPCDEGCAYRAGKK